MSPLLDWAAVGSIIFLAIIMWTRRPLPEPPPGVTIHRYPGGWTYTPSDPRMLLGGRYLTQRSALRAAHSEYQRRVTQ